MKDQVAFYGRVHSDVVQLPRQHGIPGHLHEPGRRRGAVDETKAQAHVGVLQAEASQDVGA